MKHHTITLLDGVGSGLRVPADVLIELVGAMQEGALRAARFAVEGESVRKGPKPSWLDAVGHLDITGLTQGSAVLHVESPSLAEAAPERFGPSAQVALFADPSRPLDTTQSAIDYFGGVLVSALRGDREALIADRALLDACARFARVPGRAFRAITLDGIAGAAEPLVFSAPDAERIELLRDETPPPRAARVVGTLDTISATRTDIVLRLADGTAVGARVERHDPEKLRALFAERVVVSGLAQFRPSGRLLVLDAESIGPADEGDELWAQSPSARPGRAAPVARLLPQDDRSGVAAFFGAWPGSESDEDLLAALAEVR